jgi:hypothetical protein
MKRASSGFIGGIQNFKMRRRSLKQMTVVVNNYIIKTILKMCWPRLDLTDKLTKLLPNQMSAKSGSVVWITPKGYCLSKSA